MHLYPFYSLLLFLLPFSSFGPFPLVSVPLYAQPLVISTHDSPLLSKYCSFRFSFSCPFCFPSSSTAFYLSSLLCTSTPLHYILTCSLWSAVSFLSHLLRPVLAGSVPLCPMFFQCPFTLRHPAYLPTVLSCHISIFFCLILCCFYLYLHCCPSFSPFPLSY